MKRYILILSLLAVISAEGQVKKADSPWPLVQQQMRPWTRWWWMGNAVDEKNLASALSAYAAAGIGGVEITPIYGAKGFEDRYIDFLSPRWMSMLSFTVNKAKALGMGVDMNTGTGWPFGGPQITPQFAASKLVLQRYLIPKGESLKESITIKDEKQRKAGAVLQAVTAYAADGQVFSLFDKVDAKGQLQWTAPASDVEIYAIFSGRTLQQVKRAAPSGEGYTLDHLDKASVDVYLERFDQAFKGKSPGVRSFFNDSYEVYGANWTPTFLKAFKQLKGYDLSTHIRALTGKDSTSTEAGRLKSDYRETMSKLLLENFTQNWTSWAHRYKSLTKNQSHGSPGNLLDLYATVDIPETETFGSSHFDIPGVRRDSADIRNVDPDPVMSKFASSAAHTTGKTLVSSETFTWLTEHFKTSFSQAKPEAEQLFLSGINHIFYHGTTFSPAEIPFPGWLFYASTNMVPANSLWPQLKGMDDYFTRCQSLLQSGRSDNELLIYWPVYDAWSNPKGMDMPMKVHDVDVWLYPSEFYRQSLKLAGLGYSFDFASDHMLAGARAEKGLLVTSPKASPYQTLIIPAAKLMPLKTLEDILALARNGATVIFQQFPEDVPGLADLEKNRSAFKSLIAGLDLKSLSAGVKGTAYGSGQILLAKEIQKALAFKKLDGEKLTETGLKFIRRKLTNGKYYFLVNHTAKTIDEYIPLNSSSPLVTLLDPLSGDYGRAQTQTKEGKTWVKVHLQPGETFFLQTGSSPIIRKPWTYLAKPAETLVLDDHWDLHFTQGGPVLPADKHLDKLISWTKLNDSLATSFSGTGAYTRTFTMPRQLQGEYLLNLGKVDESAHVWINGKDAGIIWSIPFQARIGKFLRPGQNTIRIEVANLMANRIRYMDQKGIPWRNYHEINFVNINYKPFDASAWEPMPSGLLGPVKITGYH
ncbi:glycosyl hydrolase [Pedobacter westerhofensis]|uniref:glycosyl hydrolase n=1 Tax=Pedobacter westerhofensis TaxID=425512 RepID=UPI00115C2026|nr:glycosyl hydrolase [Pedobacter westerhofensis]